MYPMTYEGLPPITETTTTEAAPARVKVRPLLDVTVTATVEGDLVTIEDVVGNTERVSHVEVLPHAGHTQIVPSEAPPTASRKSRRGGR
jgi:hypothetical protein